MANDPVQIEYNQELEPLERLLAGVKRAGDFFASGTMEIPLPKVEVESVGILSFPVPAAQVTALIKQATRAPYGRGEATILDESVRKVWQLPPEKVKIGGKSWALNFESIVNQAAAGLGCDGKHVRADLYKMLVYDRDGFFQAHRDTEKAAGMFGTLVIVLPSAHRGGELIIRHTGREITVDMSKAEFSEVCFVAFYADCEHEVRPITEGNRVCLVYNLIREHGGKGAHHALEAPNYDQQIATAAELLKNGLSGPDTPAKLAWLLEHQYSPDGLAFAALKAADAARAQVLSQAAERAGCAVHLGIVHIEESGSAEGTYYEPRGRGWYRQDDDDESETEENGNDEFQIVEVHDGRHYINEWRDPSDQPVEFGVIPLEPGELLPDGALDDEKPDQQRLMEASGNEGASFERSYHRAALVIWRRDRYSEVLLQAGVAAVLPYLKEQIETAETPDAPPAARKEAAALARRLVNAWKSAPGHAGLALPGKTGPREVMLRLLTRLGDISLLEEFISEVVVRDYDGSDNVALAAGARLLDAEEAGGLITELVRKNMREGRGHCVELLAMLTRKGKVPAKPEWREALHQIAGAIVGELEVIGKPRGDGEWAMDDRQWDDDEDVQEGWRWQTNRPVRVWDAQITTKLLDALSDLDAGSLRMAAAKKLAARPEVFEPVTVLVPALAAAREQNDEAALQLWEHCTAFLLARSGTPPAAPKDWRQEVKLSCSCPDCRELQAFAVDPAAQVHRFRVRMDRRQHLHQQIERHRLDMTHVTERQGSPQTLVCTKDRRSYQRRCEQYRKDIAALSALADQARKISDDGRDQRLKLVYVARSLAAKWSPKSQ